MKKSVLLSQLRWCEGNGGKSNCRQPSSYDSMYGATSKPLNCEQNEDVITFAQLVGKHKDEDLLYQFQWYKTTMRK